MDEIRAPITKPATAESIVGDPLSVKAFDTMTIIVIVLSATVCVLSMVTGIACQENGRLQGELSRVEAQLRNIRAK